MLHAGTDDVVCDNRLECTCTYGCANDTSETKTSACLGGIYTYLGRDFNDLNDDGIAYSGHGLKRNILGLFRTLRGILEVTIYKIRRRTIGLDVGRDLDSIRGIVYGTSDNATSGSTLEINDEIKMLGYLLSVLGNSGPLRVTITIGGKRLFGLVLTRSIAYFLRNYSCKDNGWIFLNRGLTSFGQMIASGAGITINSGTTRLTLFIGGQRAQGLRLTRGLIHVTCRIIDERVRKICSGTILTSLCLISFLDLAIGNRILVCSARTTLADSYSDRAQFNCNVRDKYRGESVGEGLFNGLDLRTCRIENGVKFDKGRRRVIGYRTLFSRFMVDVFGRFTASQGVLCFSCSVVRGNSDRPAGLVGWEGVLLATLKGLRASAEIRGDGGAPHGERTLLCS